LNGKSCPNAACYFTALTLLNIRIGYFEMKQMPPSGKTVINL
jgi:hypothetical protein